MDETVHRHGFKYILVPCDISREVEVLETPPNLKEGDFKKLMTSHFGRKGLTGVQKAVFCDSLREEAAKQAAQKGENCEKNREQNEKQEEKNKKNEEKNDVKIMDEKFRDELIEKTVVNTGSYQIIPLTLPKKDNYYIGINAYIDAVGKVKELDENSRASQLCSDDIRGDLFLSKTFDDEDSPFRRLDISRTEYEELTLNPPDKSGRWDQNAFLQQMLTKGNSQNTPVHEQEPLSCANCFAQKSSLQLCSKCKTSAYCSQECQKNDWKFHKRICHT